MICMQGLNLKGSIRYLLGCCEEALDPVYSGKIDVKSLNSNRFQLEHATKAFELMKQGRSDVFKVVMQGY